MNAVVALVAAGIVIAVLAPWARRSSASSGDHGCPNPARGRSPARWAPTRRASRSASRAARARSLVVVPVAAGALVLVAALVGVPPWTVPAAVVVVLTVRSRARTVRRRRHERLVDRASPDLVDLLAVAAAAGHPVHRCLAVVADRAPPPVRPPVRSTCRRLDRGAPLAVALDDLRRGLGAMGDPVADALLDAFRTGAPLQPSLERVAAVARDRRRRDAEVEARRLPVLLLFPLVCCVLPAFGLLAVVPLVVASLRSLG